MRVALNGYFWDQPRTGSGQYLRHLWAELPGVPAITTPDVAVPADEGQGSDTFVLLLPSSWQGGDPVPAGPGQQVIEARAASGPAARSQYLSKILWEQVGATRLAGEHDAALLHVPYLAAPLWRRGLPLVVTAHDMIPWVVPGYRGSPAFRLYLALAARAAKHATLILADSQASRNDVIRVLRVSPRRVRTVYLGVEPCARATEEQLAAVREKFGLAGHFAFYLGGFDRRKNVPLLLRAWRRVLDSTGEAGVAETGEPPVLAIGGRAPEPGGVFPDVIGEARKLGFDGQSGPARFLGPVSDEEKVLLMAAARLFVYPSAYEGFGLDPLQAMAVGCPVVSSSGGSLVEVVGDGGLLVPPDDERALSEAIVLAWWDTSLRTDLVARGGRQASRFTWERTARQTAAAYGDAYRIALARKQNRGER